MYQCTECGIVKTSYLDMQLECSCGRLRVVLMESDDSMEADYDVEVDEEYLLG